MIYLKTRCYSELQKLKTFNERFDYLKIGASVGQETFGGSRYLNQVFYKSKEWKNARRLVIIRDRGCDLGIDDRIIFGESPIIHHMNPITSSDIVNRNPDIYNPEYLICVSVNTHEAIHFGDKNLLQEEYVERKPNDTCPWKE